jgi:hypothetical protein
MGPNSVLLGKDSQNVGVIAGEKISAQEYGQGTGGAEK